MGLGINARNKIDSAIGFRADFSHGNVSARSYLRARDVPTGQLPSEHRDALSAIGDALVYVVFSYATPIAWFGPDGWIVPDVKYSQTTSCHQGAVRVSVHYATVAAA